MSRLVPELARRIRERMQASARDVNGASAELRSVFHGPPMEFLGVVFKDLVSGGGIEVEGGDGRVLKIPVVLVVERLSEGQVIAPIGQSGICDLVNITNYRNHPDCPRYVLLVPPSCHLSRSNSSATDSFGLAPDSNSGNATTDEWLRDGFIQSLIHAGLGYGAWKSEDGRDEARKLVEKAVRAADEIDRHNVNRYHAWCVLSRLFGISGTPDDFPIMVSLACGFPPMRDGAVHAEEQAKILDDLASQLEAQGFITGIKRMKLMADEATARALDEFLLHLQGSCEVATLFGRAAPFHYGPLQDREIGAPPQWWSALTVERWLELQEEEHQPEGALGLRCCNAIFPPRKGFAVLVLNEVKLEVALPDDVKNPVAAVLSRKGGGAANAREWQVRIEGVAEMQDTLLPPHRVPMQYSATAVGLKKTTLKVVSLQSWEPGVFVYCRTATKLSPPTALKGKKAQAAFECSATLRGAGRHYFELYMRPGVTVESEARGYDAGGQQLEGGTSPVNESAENMYGFEIDVSGECYFDLYVHKALGEAEIVRIHVSCDEIEPEGCRSEFERLIRLNRQRDDARAIAVVQVDRQVRSANLQSWLLHENWVDTSFYPLVMSTDYADVWRVPNWREPEKAILSRGRFLHDPRPTYEEMQLPRAIAEARVAIAKRLRGEDQESLIEAARLGEWVSADVGFSELVERYVEAYFQWLESAPDIAPWMDVVVVCALEQDGKTLAQEPDAVLVNPLHPLRIGWHCLAQRVMLQAYQRHMPCPASSILDAGCVPDTLALPLRTPTGVTKRQVYFSLESSSDYWAILWNADRLDKLAARGGEAPFDREFGVRVGGVSSGFSEAQVRRALDDVHDVLAAKPVVSVMVSSAAGQTNACNEGIVSWCRDQFAPRDGAEHGSLGTKLIQLLDERREDARPDDAEISNLAEDTGNSVRWFAGGSSVIRPDLGIIAQLEASNAGPAPDEVGSPVGYGALIRQRIRRQLNAGAGAFLVESRMGTPGPPSGDGLADKLSRAVARLENLVEQRLGYTFAPSVNSMSAVLEKADFAAVSSSVVDPACFLGGWLPESYLWDYELPSYSRRSGDTNGYYLLSKIKEIDFQTLRTVLARLPGCKEMSDEALGRIILEVANRGIPTVRGLAGGDSGAAGDLGLLIASRLLQDEFRDGDSAGSLLPILAHSADGGQQLVLVVPVDPFRGYLDDLQNALRTGSNLRPDLLVVGIVVSDSSISCQLTPVEVKYRGGEAVMPAPDCQDALGQARSLASLLASLRERARDPELVMWKVAFQHLVVSMISYAFRVYSQRRVATSQAKEWTQLHARCVEAIFADAMELVFDPKGRLIIVDGSSMSALRDNDADGFDETIVLCATDAASVIKDSNSQVCTEIRGRVGSWGLLPLQTEAGTQPNSQVDVMPAPSADSLVMTQSEPLEHPATQVPLRGGTFETAAGGVANPPPPPYQPTATTTASSDLRQEADWVNGPAPAVGSKGVELIVGHTLDGFRQDPRLLLLSDTDLTHLNIGVVGNLGTGKTQLLKSIIWQTMHSAARNRGVRPRFLIFDYKRDYCSPEFVDAIGARVVKPQKLSMNLFDVSQAGGVMTPWLERFRFFSDLLDKIYSGVGPVQRNQLKQAVKQAYEECNSAGRQPTIYDIHARYKAALGSKSDAILAIIDDLVDMEIFAYNPGDIASFDRFLDGAVVVDLSVVGQDDRSKNVIVAIMLNLFYENMLRLPKRPYAGTNPQLRVLDSFLLVDEADSIMRYEFDVLRKVLLQGREFGVGVILASQYLGHFKSGPTDYREPLLTWFIHQVPNLTPQELSGLGLSTDLAQLAERVRTLQRHQCLYKSFGVPGEIIRGLPFYELLRREPEIR